MSEKKVRELTNQDRVNKYLKELTKIYSVLDSNKQALLFPHLSRIAFMKVKLEELEVMIDETGMVERYQNGENQFGMKPSAAVRTYNDTCKTFIAETKFVESYLPSEAKQSKLSML